MEFQSNLGNCLSFLENPSKSSSRNFCRCSSGNYSSIVFKVWFGNSSRSSSRKFSRSLFGSLSTISPGVTLGILTSRISLRAFPIMFLEVFPGIVIVVSTQIPSETLSVVALQISSRVPAEVVLGIPSRNSPKITLGVFPDIFRDFFREFLLEFRGFTGNSYSNGNSRSSTGNFSWSSTGN